MRSFRPDATRRQTVMALVHVAAFLVPLAMAWGRDGPSADRVFWLFLTYMAEIVVFGAFELAFDVRRARRER